MLLWSISTGGGNLRERHRKNTRMLCSCLARGFTAFPGSIVFIRWTSLFFIHFSFLVSLLLFVSRLLCTRQLHPSSIPRKLDVRARMPRDQPANRCARNCCLFRRPTFMTACGGVPSAHVWIEGGIGTEEGPGVHRGGEGCRKKKANKKRTAPSVPKWSPTSVLTGPD